MTSIYTKEHRAFIIPPTKPALRTLRVGLFGCGVVGSGVAKILNSKRNEFRRHFNTDVIIEKICVKDVDKERDIQLGSDLLTSNAEELLDDRSIDVIIEVIGGYDDAKNIILRALSKGKSVITANKFLLSSDIELLRRTAQANNVQLLYAASVCGSVPVLRSVDELRQQDTIKSIRGIVNGSTNFILTLLSNDDCSVEHAMSEARRLGFLEADPSLDVSGQDAAQKLSVLIYHAFGEHIPPQEIKTIGIEKITREHIESALQEHCVIKLIASAYRSSETGKIIASVEPERIAKSHLFAHTSDEFNALEIVAANAGPQLLYGKGAGSLPTASAVVSDLVTLVKNM